MDIKCVTGVYFGKSCAAKRIATAVSSVISENVDGFDICDKQSLLSSAFERERAAVFAMPVSGGRLSAMAAKRLRELSGGGAAAVAVVLCSENGFGDSLLELSDLLTKQGFCVIGAAAFVSDGRSRPDDGDFSKLVEFASACAGKLEEFSGGCCKLSIPGNHPYKERQKRLSPFVKAFRHAAEESAAKSSATRTEPEWFL